MKKIIQLSAIALTVSLVFTQRVNAQNTWSEARNDAMGGTGVASAHYSSGVLINPALLAKGKPDDGVAIMLPSAWGQVTSLGNIEHHIDTIAYRVNKYKYAITELKVMNLFNFGKPLKRYRNAAGDLADALSQLDDRTVHANAAVGVAVSIPLDELSVAFVTKARLHAGLSSAIDPSDIAYLRSIQNSDAVAMKEVSSAMMGGSKQLTEKLRSMAFGRGAIIVDYGVAVARQFDISGLPVSFGVTPKVQRVQLYNYSGSIYSWKISDFNYRRYRQSETGFNLDAGVAVDVTDNWTIGVSGQNLASRNIDTRAVNGYKDTYQIHPLVTVGMAWNSKLLTLSADVDVTETKRFKSENNSQYVGVGAEMRPFGWLAMRAGYRVDINDRASNFFTAGLGFSPFRWVNFDLTSVVGKSNTLGVGAQLLFTF